MLRRDDGVERPMMLYQSIESHEPGGTDEMDVTRRLDPFTCPGVWNRGFILGSVFRLVL